jgi:hypothetical protein
MEFYWEKEVEHRGMCRKSEHWTNKFLALDLFRYIAFFSKKKKNLIKQKSSCPITTWVRQGSVLNLCLSWVHDWIQLVRVQHDTDTTHNATESRHDTGVWHGTNTRHDTDLDTTRHW